MQNILANPALSASQRVEVIKLLTQQGGGGAEASKAIKNLLEVMSENGRLGHLDGVVGAFERIMRAHKGEVEVVVTSSQVLILLPRPANEATGFKSVESFGTIHLEISLDSKRPKGQNGK